MAQSEEVADIAMADNRVGTRSNEIEVQIDHGHTLPPPSDVGSLQRALAEALRAKEEVLCELGLARSAQHGTHTEEIAVAGNISEYSKCFLLESIPIEVRKMIYGLLLVKDVLSHISSIPMQSSGRPTGGAHATPRRPNYGLTIQLLRTCKQIEQEASEVLYRENTFILDFQRSTQESFSPLYRQIHPRHPIYGPSAEQVTYGTHYKDLATHPHLPKIRRWRVIVGTDSRYDQGIPPCRGIFEFCKVLIKNPAKTLKVVVALKNEQQNNPVFFPTYPSPNLRSVLRPFKKLRGIADFELVAGTLVDSVQLPLPQAPRFAFAPGPGAPVPPMHRLPSGFALLKAELEPLVQGSMDVFSPEEMYNSLVRYGQAFERNPRYKEEMAPGYEEIVQRVILAKSDLQSGSGGPNIAPLPSDLEIITSEDLRDFGNPNHYLRPQTSPFKGVRCHPVELGLEVASYAWETGKLRQLKRARRDVLEFLEPQYKRVVRAAADFNAFVKESKLHGGLLDPISMPYIIASTYSNCNLDRARLTLSAEKYSDAFLRDIPASLEIIFRIEKDVFDRAYEFLPRELLLLKLDAQLKDGAPLGQMIETFKAVADDMDAQYLEIREARKALFLCDPDDHHGIKLDLELSRCDEMVDWSVAEPLIIVPKAPPRASIAPVAPLVVGNAPNAALGQGGMGAIPAAALQNLMNALLPAVVPGLAAPPAGAAPPPNVVMNFAIAGFGPPPPMPPVFGPVPPPPPPPVAAAAPAPAAPAFAAQATIDEEDDED